MKNVSKKSILFGAWLIIIIIGFLLPQHFASPVAGASRSSYHPKSFWYYPWGKSGTHKGVDIFAKEGTHVNAATGGLGVFAGELGRGGNVVLVLGAKWRLHYYAHLRDMDTHVWSWTRMGQRIGTVGTTGNARESRHICIILS